MLTLLAHDGAPLAPHDVWTAWNADPMVVVPMLVAAALYARGAGSLRATRPGLFATGMVVAAVALLSPVDALAGVLMSAHMVQHVLLMFVAAPLLATAAPGPVLLRGLPTAMRRRLVAAGRASGATGAARSLRGPVLRWLLFVAVLWLWHASVLYSAAVEHRWVHALEHATFLGAAVLVWSTILGPRRIRLPAGLGLLSVFAMMLQGIVLAALITFSSFAWYEPYRDGAAGWSVDPLADQRLAGLLMWFPAGLVHVVVAGILLARLLAEPAADDEPAEFQWRRARRPDSDRAIAHTPSWHERAAR